MTKPPSKYTLLDEQILAKTRLKPIGFTAMQSRHLMSSASRFATATRPDWRVVDVRLQALRTAGKIHHQAGAWHITEPAQAAVQA
jgi:hypothetical protein